MTPKIIELLIEDNDDEAGLDGIALVNMPAHEAAFEYFAKEEEEKCSHYVLSDDKVPEVIQMFHSFGEPQGLLEKEGFKITKVKKVGKKEFAILADPNAPSSQDTPTVKFRYKYVGPQDEKNRTFCAQMMRANRVFRIEDIDEMSRRDVNAVGPDGYSIFEWRGSYNCRHRWVQLMYEQDTTIINKSSVRRGLIEEDDMPGPNTLTTSAREAGYAPRTGFSTENPNVSALSPYVDQVTKKVIKKPVLASLPMFENREDAEALAEVMGCKGSHPMVYGDKTLYMPCEEHFAELEDACWEGYEPIGLKPDGAPNCVPIKEEMNDEGEYVIGDFKSYDNYPELIRKNAQSALDYIERTGNPNNCMTQVGKVRAQQLAQGKPISIETIKRMKSFLSRHKSNLETSKSYDDGCGKLALDAWGGIEALPWVEKTINSYEELNSTETTFSVFNTEQRLVVGPAMIPDKMIIRRNDITGEIYYVYFSAETIKKLQQKFMKEKLLDKTNLEHGRKFLTDVDVVESWIVDDREKDKQQVFGMDYPEGTWMITMKVTDDKTWEKVKDGELKGFSVQGYFLEKAKFSQINQEVIDEIKNILKQVNNGL
jgi:hypothetical protein